jgi:hypothetical protein
MVTLVFVLSLMLFGSVSAENATGKGHWMIDGSSTAGFAKASGELWEDGNGDTPSTFQISPSLSYFLADGLALGALVIFQSSTWGDTKTTGFHAGPQLTWFPTGKNVTESKGEILPYLNASIRLMSDKTTYEDSENGTAKRVAAFDDEFTESGWAARFMAGGMFFASTHVGLHANAYFELQSAKFKTNVDGNESESDSFSGSEFGIMLGVTGFFGGSNSNGN